MRATGGRPYFGMETTLILQAVLVSENQGSSSVFATSNNSVMENVVNSEVVRLVTMADRETVLNIMKRAFLEDSLLRWIYVERERYLEHFAGFLDAYCGDPFSAQNGLICTDGDSGVAALLWTPSTMMRSEEELYSFLQDTASESRRDEIIGLFDKFGHCHPSGPHSYITLFGKDPSCEKEGVGAALMRHWCDMCGRDQIVIYGEATSEMHVKYYERFGTELVETVQHGTSPKFYPMVRPPR